MTYVPANHDDYSLIDKQREAIIRYLVSKAPEKTLKITREELYNILDEHWKEDTWVKTDWTDSEVIISLTEAEFKTPYGGLTWIEVPEFDIADALGDLVPHG